MKKISLLVLLTITSLYGLCQVSVSPDHRINGKFNKGVIERFKNTTTIFVLSNIYDKKTYQEVLEQSWTVTPFMIVSEKDFLLTDYLSKDYSFAHLTGYIKYKSKNNGPEFAHSLYCYIDITMYDVDKINAKLQKMSPEKRKKKKKRIINKFKEHISRIFFYPKDSFLYYALLGYNPYDQNDKKELHFRGANIDSVRNKMLNHQFFLNYYPGFIKNKLQIVSSTIENNKTKWMFKKNSKKDLSHLVRDTLLVPKYISIKHLNPSKDYAQVDIEFLHELFEDYKFPYKIIDDEELSGRIMNGEEFYYLSYTRMTTEKFIQVVNSKTGEVIYSVYIPGFRYNLKSKYFEKLSDEILDAK